MTSTILHIDASARLSNSTTRDLSQQILNRLAADTLITRDLASALPLITDDWIGANFTPKDQRDEMQREVLSLSDTLVDEIIRADTLVIGLPIYNFSIPASFKVWIDLVAHAGLSFQYTDTGPIGLLTGKRAIIGLASGGTTFGSDTDFASDYVRHALAFIGISDVTFIAADAMGVEPEKTLAAAQSAVQALAA